MPSPFGPLLVCCSLVCVAVGFTVPWLWVAIVLWVVAAIGIGMAVYDWIYPV